MFLRLGRDTTITHYETCLLLMTNFHFLLCRLTTEAMGIWRFAGAFAVVERQSECGSKTAGMHVSQPMNIGVCYGLGAFPFSYFASSNIASICLSRVFTRFNSGTVLLLKNTGSLIQPRMIPSTV
jgi:hypothetical protein